MKKVKIWLCTGVLLFSILKKLFERKKYIEAKLNYSISLKTISLFNKNYLNKSIIIFKAINTISLITRLIIKLISKFSTKKSKVDKPKALINKPKIVKLSLVFIISLTLF